MVKVSIIIINYNTYQLTYNCIQSIYDKCHGLDYEIILVDNSSNECNPDVFLEKFPNIVLVKSRENAGFSKGNNLGIEKAIGQYILLLNSDTVLVNDAVSICYEYLHSHATVGVVTTKLIFPDGRIQSTCQRFPNVVYNLLELFRIQKFLPKLGAQLLLAGFFDYKSVAKVDWTWGAFFMFPKNVLTQLPNNHLHDDFFMYCEDLKWCFDIHKAGYEIHYIPQGEVIHYMGSSGGAKKPLMIKNHNTFMNENFNWFHRNLIYFSEWLLKVTSREN